MGLQCGFTKFPYYICIWDRRKTAAHYDSLIWPLRTEFSVEKNKYKWVPIWDPESVLSLSLLLKLNFMIQFITTLD